MSKVKLCRHCGIKPVGRPRGLCWRCAADVSVRESYPTHASFRRGILEGSSRILPKRTDALPGSPEKIAVLCARAEAGTALHHPDDPFLVPERLAAIPSYGGGPLGRGVRVVRKEDVA